MCDFALAAPDHPRPPHVGVVGRQREREVAMPRWPGPHLVLVEADAVRGCFDTLLDLPLQG
jgi:hypothetical protein